MDDQNKEIKQTSEDEISVGKKIRNRVNLKSNFYRSPTFLTA
jgi:hypothetical protein